LRVKHGETGTKVEQGDRLGVGEAKLAPGKVVKRHRQRERNQLQRNNVVEVTVVPVHVVASAAIVVEGLDTELSKRNHSQGRRGKRRRVASDKGALQHSIVAETIATGNQGGRAVHLLVGYVKRVFNEGVVADRDVQRTENVCSAGTVKQRGGDVDEKSLEASDIVGRAADVRLVQGTIKGSIIARIGAKDTSFWREGKREAVVHNVYDGRLAELLLKVDAVV